MLLQKQSRRRCVRRLSVCSTKTSRTQTRGVGTYVQIPLSGLLSIWFSRKFLVRFSQQKIPNSPSSCPSILLSSWFIRKKSAQNSILLQQNFSLQPVPAENSTQQFIFKTFLFGLFQQKNLIISLLVTWFSRNISSTCSNRNVNSVVHYQLVPAENYNLNSAAYCQLGSAENLSSVGSNRKSNPVVHWKPVTAEKFDSAVYCILT